MPLSLPAPVQLACFDTRKIANPNENFWPGWAWVVIMGNENSIQYTRIDQAWIYIESMVITFRSHIFIFYYLPMFALIIDPAHYQGIIV